MHLIIPDPVDSCRNGTNRVAPALEPGDIAGAQVSDLSRTGPPSGGVTTGREFVTSNLLPVTARRS
jgi:hypothetical protein